MNVIPKTTPANFTRRSKSLLAKFVREGRFHFIPLYGLLRLSDFAREGMDHSGSYRFADHLYRGMPSGRGWLGRWIDRVLLNLPAARAMRQRCAEARLAMQAAFQAHLALHPGAPIRMLTVPCGLPRDVRDFAAWVRERDPAALSLIEYTGLDLDEKVLSEARAFLEDTPLGQTTWLPGDALTGEDYPAASVHFISSTGLGEFLNDAALALFYRNVFAALAPGGTFFTSATAQEKRADMLLRAFELDTHYRTAAEISRLLGLLSWESLEITHDSTDLQSFVRAVKK